jgi:hypothetical protein
MSTSDLSCSSVPLALLISCQLAFSRCTPSSFPFFLITFLPLSICPRHFPSTLHLSPLFYWLSRLSYTSSPFVLFTSRRPLHLPYFLHLITSISPLHFPSSYPVFLFTCLLFSHLSSTLSILLSTCPLHFPFSSPFVPDTFLSHLNLSSSLPFYFSFVLFTLLLPCTGLFSLYFCPTCCFPFLCPLALLPHFSHFNLTPSFNSSSPLGSCLHLLT